ncbi:hypothetical protein FAZ15_12040 [Sphingobacterium olei]|uniref:Substrate import-associated zinc metallohydrolase lipoprotein n=1 Tax=Sphingobacterium olei TaxID=2571155 RepID=A0A4U0P0M4_9SPHI|nr:substrate import-associated zinc metallohydrolase lipoprotein [Sphingobacterium olei]TJZ60709.1 hypothetical protein FAZ15_12040 [Sphingobacterium olei]
MKKYLIIGTLFFFVLLNGCRKAEDLTNQVDRLDFIGDQFALNGAIDEWLYEKFTQPYNIRVQYKWDRSEVDLSKTITPIDEEKVRPLAEYILKYYLEPYAAEAGEFFIKKYPAKQYLFVGSAEHNSNGTVTLGSADKGRKVVLYRLNEIDPNNWSAVERMLKTVHHEFAHILDQNRRITAEYGLLNKADYVEDLWPNLTDQQALDLGFITRYAGSEPSEDFAEMVAVLLLYGQEFFDSQVALANANGRAKIKQKEDMVVEYFSSQWGINFRSLQQRIADLKPEVPPTPLPDFLDTFGEGKSYTYLQFESAEYSDEFQAIWDDIKNETVVEVDRHIAYMRLYVLATGQLQVRVYRYPAGSGQTGSVTYSSLYFDVATDTDDIVTFTYATSGSSAALRTNSDNLVNFITGHKFVWSWKDSDLTHGGLYVVDNNGERTGVSLVGEPRS